MYIGKNNHDNDIQIVDCRKKRSESSFFFIIINEQAISLSTPIDHK